MGGEKKIEEVCTTAKWKTFAFISDIVDLTTEFSTTTSCVHVQPGQSFLVVGIIDNSKVSRITDWIMILEVEDLMN